MAAQTQFSFAVRDGGVIMVTYRTPAPKSPLDREAARKAASLALAQHGKVDFTASGWVRDDYWQVIFFPRHVGSGQYIARLWQEAF
jgi:hypothetical protein